MRLVDGLRGAARLGQTGQILAQTGFGWLRGDRPLTPRLFRETLERLGATYVKLGQFIASSPSLFPADLVAECERCLDQTEPLPWSQLQPRLRRELGRSPRLLYREIDPEPLASASIAQVHAARLFSGEDVVIKIQKPGVEAILGTDLQFLSLATQLLASVAPRAGVSLVGIVAEIQAAMLAECDFHQEAANIEAFRAFLTATGNTAVVAPKVYPDASSRRVLTLERFHGVPMSDLAGVKARSADSAATLRSALDTWMASLMLCETFHADVHAGNLMVLDDGRVGFIDFGIVGRISPATWEALSQFMDGVAERDFTVLAEALVAIGVTDEQVDVEAFAADLQALYRQRDQLLTPQPEGEIFVELAEAGKRHGIRFPREFALLLKQFLYFDRYLQLLAPGLSWAEVRQGYEEASGEE